jgi:hypothetical protein
VSGPPELPESYPLKRNRRHEEANQPTSGPARDTLTLRAQATTGRHYASARIEYISALARLAYVMCEDAADLCLPLTDSADEAETPDETNVVLDGTKMSVLLPALK